MIFRSNYEKLGETFQNRRAIAFKRSIEFLIDKNMRGINANVVWKLSDDTEEYEQF